MEFTISLYIRYGDIGMKIEELAEVLKATAYYIPEDFDVDISFGGASDLMSDVLKYVSDMPTHIQKGMLLITGLLNPQVIRTAGLVDISVVIFTRGKIPTEEIIDKARSNNIAVLSTALKTYTACGLLYCAGIQSIDEDAYRKDNHDTK